MNVITRFPPSPTGNLHIGGARTALFNYLFAQHHGGKIYLRLENTDEGRSTPEYEQNILDSLKWLGLGFDALPEGKPFWRQSERKDIYRTHLKKLVKGGRAYISKETEGERAEVVRFKNPNKKVAFTDLIRGPIEFDTTELGDMVIAKSLDEPLYHLAVVIDDHEMGITHVIRGEDHISNTPRQILLQEAFGFSAPKYAHIPLILAPDRSKLSKRHGAVSVTEYRDKGYLAESFVNYLALLGWNPGTEREFFSLDELVKEFSLSKIHKGGAIFSEEKSRWMNREYLKRGGRDGLIPLLPQEFTKGRNQLQVRALADMFLERISVLGDIRRELLSGAYEYLFSEPEYPKELLKWEKATEDPRLHLEQVISLIEKIPETSFTEMAVKEGLTSYAEVRGKGNVLWPMRVALSGREQSPNPFILAAILGKRTTVQRLQKAVTLR